MITYQTWYNHIHTSTTFNVDREQYEKDLAELQKQHLDNIARNQNQNWRLCLHDGCPSCFG
jgi:hypothetical protein